MISAQFEDLIGFWNRYEALTKPYCHPDDWEFLQTSGRSRYTHASSWELAEYIKSPLFGRPNDTKFHLSLIPVPFLGDLNSSDILILMLNPGFDITEYGAQDKSRSYRERLRRNLRQDFSGLEFPFLGFDPEFCWSGCFAWWEKKLRDILTIVAERKFEGRYSYFDALSYFSKRLAVLQLVPYFSTSFSAGPLLNHLPSVKIAKRYAQEVARTGEKLVVVTRQPRSWDLGVSKTVICYTRAHARSASLSRRSPGGSAILRRLDIEPR